MRKFVYKNVQICLQIYLCKFVDKFAYALTTPEGYRLTSDDLAAILMWLLHTFRLSSAHISGVRASAPMSPISLNIMLSLSRVLFGHLVSMVAMLFMPALPIWFVHRFKNLSCVLVVSANASDSAPLFSIRLMLKSRDVILLLTAKAFAI